MHHAGREWPSTVRTGDTMSIWDNLDRDGHIGSSFSGENNNSFHGERDMKTSRYSDSKVAGYMQDAPDGTTHSAEMAHVSDIIENMQREVVGLRQQLMAVEDNVTGVVKASAQTTSETAKHQDIWNLEKKLQEYGSKSEAERSALLEHLEKQENFLSLLSASQESQKEAFTSFANEIRRKEEAQPQNLSQPSFSRTIPVSVDADSLENSMCADMDPVVAEMARRAGIGLEDLHDIALKITEVNKADAVAELQLAHVEKVNEQIKEISLTKMSGNQAHTQQKLFNDKEQQIHDKEIRLAEIQSELHADTVSVECDKAVRNHRDVEISKTRWEAFSAVSDQWSQAMASAARWGSIGGGISFVAYCCVQVAKVYFGQ